MSSQAEAPPRPPDTVQLPAPTVWPIVLALGVMLVAAGMVTNAAVSVLGAILAVCGYIGWFRDVLPHEKMEAVPVAEIRQRVSTRRPQVERVEFMHHDLHRARLPLEIYPVSAGVKGGRARTPAPRTMQRPRPARSDTFSAPACGAVSNFPRTAPVATGSCGVLHAGGLGQIEEQ